MIRKFLIATALGLLAFAGFASAALAEPPTKEPAPAEDLTGPFCEDFQVLVHPIANKELTLTFSDGRVQFAGQLKLEVTNVETGKTITVNASGPGLFSSDGSILTLRGATLLAGEAGFFGPGSQARLSLVGGVVVIDLATGAVLSETGHSTDLCPILADP